MTPALKWVRAPLHWDTALWGLNLEETLGSTCRWKEETEQWGGEEVWAAPRYFRTIGEKVAWALS